MTLNEGQGHRTEKRLYRPWDGLSASRPQTWSVDIAWTAGFWNNINVYFFMINICVTFNDDQGQLTRDAFISEEVTMANFNDEDFNSFRWIACETHTLRQWDWQTDRHTHTNTHWWYTCHTYTHTYTHTLTHTHTHTQSDRQRGEWRRKLLGESFQNVISHKRPKSLLQTAHRNVYWSFCKSNRSLSYWLAP